MNLIEARELSKIWDAAEPPAEEEEVSSDGEEFGDDDEEFDPTAEKPVKERIKRQFFAVHFKRHLSFMTFI